MKYLIDTNILIWFVEKNKMLPKKFLDIILNDDNQMFISDVTLWEIAIKYSIGKLNLTINLKNFLNDIYDKDYFNIVPIKSEHLLYLAKLPFIHNDPFDRLIYSISKSENFILLSTDKIFNKYDLK
jgi:PIN domain nuclease of toxin-antitoxin system